ncbi:MAG TPA: hypothetical protein VJC10_03310 [Patescibacteria group bacterium]|nr:hypothetical protein [Patescibacteria group bacterium]
MEFLKVRKNQAIIGVVLLIVLLLGGFMILGKNSSRDDGNEVIIEEEFESLDPKEIDLALELRNDGNAFRFVIGNTKDIDAFEYEYTYDADSKEEEGVKVPRGGGSDEPVEPEDSTYESEYFFFGSCSSGTCVPDSGVESVTLTLKLTKNDGKIYQIVDTLEL